jgi:hypothetical protein
LSPLSNPYRNWKQLRRGRTVTAPHTWTARIIWPDEDFACAPVLRKEFAMGAGHGEVAAATLRAMRTPTI